jgi:hypothetical protein
MFFLSTTRRLYCVFVEEAVDDGVEDEGVDDVADGLDAGSGSAKPRFLNESGAMRLLRQACSLAQSFQCANGASVQLHPDRRRYKKAVYDRNGERYGVSDPDSSKPSR